MAKPDKGGLVKFEIGIPDSLKDDNCNDGDDNDGNEAYTDQINDTNDVWWCYQFDSLKDYN